MTAVPGDTIQPNLNATPTNSATTVKLIPSNHCASYGDSLDAQKSKISFELSQEIRFAAFQPRLASGRPGRSDLGAQGLGRRTTDLADTFHDKTVLG